MSVWAEPTAVWWAVTTRLAVLVSVTVVALGVACGLAGTALYLRDVRRGSTVPHRGSWIVWSVIGVVAAVSHGGGGGRWGLVVLAAQALGTLAVLGYAIPRGIGGVTAGNVVLLTMAGLGVAGWVALSDPTAAAACAALADGAGLVAIVPKIWRDPGSETTALFALAGAGGLFVVLAAGTADPALLLFPAYYLVGNSAVAQLIVWRRRTLRRRGTGSRGLRPSNGRS